MPYSFFGRQNDDDGIVGFGVYDEKISDYQWRMLEQNKIEGVLDAVREHGSTGVRFYTRIGGRRSVEDMLESKGFGIQDFLQMSIDLATVANNSEEYLLDRGSLILDGRAILKEESGRFACFLLPLRNERGSFERRLSEFLLGVLLRTECRGVGGEISIYKEIFRKLQPSNFEMKEFCSYAEEVLISRRVGADAKPEEKDLLDQFYENVESRKAEVWKSTSMAWGADVLDKHGEMVLAGLWCLFLIVALFMKVGIFEALGGSVVFLVGLGLLKKRKADRSPGLEMNDRQWAAQTVEGEEEEIIKTPKVDPAGGTEKVARHVEALNDTIMIQDIWRPYIERLDEGSGNLEDEVQRFYIGEGIFMGRNKDLVDAHIPDPAVGKLQSEIWKEGEKYFLKDLKSRNGTWLNEIRLEPGVGIEIKDEDIIGVGSCKFVFRML